MKAIVIVALALAIAADLPTSFGGPTLPSFLSADAGLCTSDMLVNYGGWELNFKKIRGTIFLPKTGQKIIIKDFSAALTEDLDAHFYIGIVEGFFHQSRNYLYKNNNPGTPGNPKGLAYHFAYVDFTGKNEPISAKHNSKNFELDLSKLVPVRGIPKTLQTRDVAWLAIVMLRKNSVGPLAASIDFAPHFRGGWLVSLKHNFKAILTAYSSTDTFIQMLQVSMDSSAAGMNVRFFAGTDPWSCGEAELKKITSAADGKNIIYFPKAAKNENGEITKDNPLRTRLYTNEGWDSSLLSKHIRWMALYEARPCGDVVAYLESYV